MPLVAGDEVFGPRRRGALRKLGVVEIGQGRYGPCGATTSSLSRNIAITAAISGMPASPPMNRIWPARSCPKAAGAARTYQDVISGRTFDRPGLDALLDYARAGDTLAVVRLDRLGRSLRELLEVVETLKERQIALVSLEEKIDAASAAGELVSHVFGPIARFERRLIAERTRDGVAAACAAGRHPGRPKLDHEKLRAALTLIRDGMSPTKAARHVGLGRSTLYRELALISGALRRVA